jgi:hypothetical protein
VTLHRREREGLCQEHGHDARIGVGNVFTQRSHFGAQLREQTLAVVVVQRFDDLTRFVEVRVAQVGVVEELADFQLTVLPKLFLGEIENLMPCLRATLHRSAQDAHRLDRALELERELRRFARQNELARLFAQRFAQPCQRTFVITLAAILLDLLENLLDRGHSHPSRWRMERVS